MKPSPLPWLLKITPDIITVIDDDLYPVATCTKFWGQSFCDADLIARAVNNHAKLLEAVKAADCYFRALAQQWVANEGRVVSDVGTVIEGSEEVNRLCNDAAEKTMRVLISMREP